MSNTAEIKIPAHVDFCTGELRNAKFPLVSSSPSSLTEGRFWYDSVNHLPKYYDGTNEREFGRIYSAGTGISISNTNVISFDNSVLSGYVQTDSVAELEGLTLVNEAQIIFPGGSIVNEVDFETGANRLTISSYDNEEQADSPLTLYGSTLTFNGYDVITSENVGVASGVAELDSNGKVPSSQLPSFVDDVIEAYVRSSSTALGSLWLSTTSGGPALTPEEGKIYVILSSGTYLNKTYRWSGTTYVEISASPGNATESAAGIIEIATNSEVTTGTDDTRAVTPKKLADNYQTKINSSNKLSSDLVDDTNKTHKFATAAQLSQIATNTSDISSIYEQINSYGSVVEHDADEFATSEQGYMAETSLQKLVEENSALTASSGAATWTVNHSFENDELTVTVYEIGNNSSTIVYPKVEVSSSTVVITFLTSSNIAASTYKVVIAGQVPAISGDEQPA